MKQTMKRTNQESAPSELLKKARALGDVARARRMAGIFPQPVPPDLDGSDADAETDEKGGER